MKYLLSLNSGGLKYSQSVYFVADWLVQLDKATLDVENISRGPQIPYVRNKRRLVTKAFMINLYILRGLKNILICIKETFTELSYRIWFRHACSGLPWNTTLLIVHCFTSLTIETITPWNVFILLYFNVNNIGMSERDLENDPWKSAQSLTFEYCLAPLSHKLLTGFVQEHRKEKTLSFKIIWTFFFLQFKWMYCFFASKVRMLGKS